jgi:hypothetical protein
MNLEEFNEIKGQVVAQTKDITQRMIGWDEIANRVDNHAPYESGQIDDHFNNAFDEVLSPEIFTRDRKAEIQKR